VVPEDILVPVTVLPTSIEEAPDTEVTVKLPKVVTPLDTVVDDVGYVGSNVGDTVGTRLGDALGFGVGELAL
jgi:hypothetical protein